MKKYVSFFIGAFQISLKLSLIWVILSFAVTQVSAAQEQIVVIVAGQSNAGRIAPHVEAAFAAQSISAQVINCAECSGGSSIWDWSDGMFLYRSCLSRASFESVDAVFFHQGERDAQLPGLGNGAEEWRASFLQMVANFRRDLARPDLMVLAAILGADVPPGNFPKWNTVRSQQETLYTNPADNVGLVFSDGLVTGADHVHYDPPEARALADRFVAEYLYPLRLSASTNRATFSTGETLDFTVGASSPGLLLRSGGIVDIYAVILLPGGDTVVNFTGLDGAFELGSLSDLGALIPMVASLDMFGPAFDVTLSPFFTYDWTGAEPAGTYSAFVVMVDAGSLSDGSMEALTRYLWDFDEVNFTFNP